MSFSNNNLKAIEPLSIHAFLANNKIKTETGQELDFRKYYFFI